MYSLKLHLTLFLLVLFFANNILGQFNYDKSLLIKEKIALNLGTFTNEIAVKNKIFKKKYIYDFE
jgi:hypothetical protein